MPQLEPSRRQFLAIMAGSLPVFATSPGLAGPPAARTLSFAHTHTGERLQVAYFSGGRYVADALLRVNRFLRDFRTGDVHKIDPALLDLLHRLAQATRTSHPFQVISAYRSPITNAALRQRTEGVAVGSLHMQGRAMDIRLADIPLQKLRAAALALRGGGVGYYPVSNFIHVDTGRVRTW